ncbi:MAG TPA: hypothetical protein VFH58_00375 [Acidimicrobiales bacterium]|nr:hypothetical protein [Acidimicrobiales bacterium]
MKSSAEEVADVPPGVVTVTSTVPAAPAGEVAVTRVESTAMTSVAGLAPKLTPVAPVRLVPVIVTDVPPALGPDEGLTPVTVGGQLIVMDGVPVLSVAITGVVVAESVT